MEFSQLSVPLYDGEAFEASVKSTWELQTFQIKNVTYYVQMPQESTQALVDARMDDIQLSTLSQIHTQFTKNTNKINNYNNGLCNVLRINNHSFSVNSIAYCLQSVLIAWQSISVYIRSEMHIYYFGPCDIITSQPDYYTDLLSSVQSTCRTRSSSVVTLARPSVSSSLQITNRSFTYASPHLWNQLPLHSVNLILFTLFLIHLILHISPHHSPCFYSHLDLLLQT